VTATFVPVAPSPGAPCDIRGRCQDSTAEDEDFLTHQLVSPSLQIPFLEV